MQIDLGLAAARDAQQQVGPKRSAVLADSPQRRRTARRSGPAPRSGARDRRLLPAALPLRARSALPACSSGALRSRAAARPSPPRPADGGSSRSQTGAAPGRPCRDRGRRAAPRVTLLRSAPARRPWCARTRRSRRPRCSCRRARARAGRRRHGDVVAAIVEQRGRAAQSSATRAMLAEARQESAYEAQCVQLQKVLLKRAHHHDSEAVSRENRQIALAAAGISAYRHRTVDNPVNDASGERRAVQRCRWAQRRGYVRMLA